MSKCSVFIATSLDGYIAREDGSIDWLPDPDTDEKGNGEDYGYQDFMSKIDAIVMGRHTFDLVLSFDQWPYGDMPIFVLSTRKVKIPDKIKRSVKHISGDPGEITQKISEQGYKHLYIDGGKTIQGFLNAGLIEELTITTIPVLIGSGIPLFGALNKDIHLSIVESRTFKNRVVQTRYKVHK